VRQGWIVAWAAVCLSTAACTTSGPPGAGGSGASCAGPYVETEPRQAQPGHSLTVRGDGYVDACNDTGESRPAQALGDLPVTFEQAGERTEVGRLDASGSGGTVITTIIVPVDARPGLAEVTVGLSPPALVMVGDGRGGYPPWPSPPTGPSEPTVGLQAMPSFPEGDWVLASATTVDVRRRADEALAAPAPAGTGTAWETEVRILDRPVQMTCTHQAGGCGRHATG